MRRKLDVPENIAEALSILNDIKMYSTVLMRSLEKDIQPTASQFVEDILTSTAPVVVQHVSATDVMDALLAEEQANRPARPGVGEPVPDDEYAVNRVRDRKPAVTGGGERKPEASVPAASPRSTNPFAHIARVASVIQHVRCPVPCALVCVKDCDDRSKVVRIVVERRRETVSNLVNRRRSQAAVRRPGTGSSPAGAPP